MLLKCTCDSYLGNKSAATYQDNKYGNKIRVHTPTIKEPKGSHWRCTICKNERTKGGVEEPKKRGK